MTSEQALTRSLKRNKEIYTYKNLLDDTLRLIEDNAEDGMFDCRIAVSGFKPKDVTKLEGKLYELGYFYRNDGSTTYISWGKV